jgi:hypothetical protein
MAFMRTDMRTRVVGAIARWSPEERDAVLYAAAALFAGVTILASSIALYRQWAELAVGPYLFGVLASVIAAHHVRSEEMLFAGEEKPALRSTHGAHWTVARTVIFLVVLVGAALLPLALEVYWQVNSGGSAHIQPEAVVIEGGANRIVEGKDLYENIGKGDKPPSGEPAYEQYFPYLPGMAVFGFFHHTKAPPRLTDARVAFSLITVLLVAWALALCRGPAPPRVLTLQSMTVLPTAALPLATGGDDLPVAALMLLGLLFLQRRRPVLAGAVLGAALSLKFTAWPLAVLAFLVVRDRESRRAPGWLLLGMALVAVPAVLPVALQNPSAFVDNAIRFPLGLAGVASPANSPLPGHLFVSVFPNLHRMFTLFTALVGGAVIVWVLVKRPPGSAADLSRLVAWIMAVAILLAPATRVGYLLYPVNLFIWAWLLRSEDSVAHWPATLRRTAVSLPIVAGHFEGEGELAGAAGRTPG